MLPALSPSLAGRTPIDPRCLLSGGLEGVRGHRWRVLRGHPPSFLEPVPGTCRCPRPSAQSLRGSPAPGRLGPRAPQQRGQPCDLRWAEKALPGAVADARTEDFRLHDTRHTFASRFAMEGVDLLTIKEPGGWKGLSTVARYAHISPSHRKQAIERPVTRKSEPGPARVVGAE